MVWNTMSFEYVNVLQCISGSDSFARCGRQWPWAMACQLAAGCGARWHALAQKAYGPCSACWKAAMPRHSLAARLSESFKRRWNLRGNVIFQLLLNTLIQPQRTCNGPSRTSSAPWRTFARQHPASWLSCANSSSPCCVCLVMMSAPLAMYWQPKRDKK